MAGTPAIGEVSKSAIGAGMVKSEADYRFYALVGGPVQRPSMVRVAEDGAAIDMEIWEMSAQHFGNLVGGIFVPLGIGRVKLAEGSWVSGFDGRSRLEPSPTNAPRGLRRAVQPLPPHALPGW